MIILFMTVRVIVRTNFEGLNDFISFDCNLMRLVLLGYYLFAVINQSNNVIVVMLTTVKNGPNDCLR